jgi:hypothetical protein
LITVPSDIVKKAYNDFGFAVTKSNQVLYDKLRKVCMDATYDDKEIIGTLQVFLLEVIRASLEDFNQNTLDEQGEDLR